MQRRCAHPVSLPLASPAAPLDVSRSSHRLAHSDTHSLNCHIPPHAHSLDRSACHQRSNHLPSTTTTTSTTTMCCHCSVSSCIHPIHNPPHSRPISFFPLRVRKLCSQQSTCPSVQATRRLAELAQKPSKVYGALTPSNSLCLSLALVSFIPAHLLAHSLAGLTSLYLNQNHLSSIPPEICMLEHLEILDLSHNEVSG